MNQSIIKGLGTPQLSRIIEEGPSHSRRSEQESIYNLTQYQQKVAVHENQQLDQIEQQIKQIGKQLQDLHFQMKKIQDKYSEQYLQKQNFRNNLRKKLIDLDYHHKTVFAKRIKKNNTNSMTNQFYHNKIAENSSVTTVDKGKQRNEAAQQKLEKYLSPSKTYQTEVEEGKEKDLRSSERRNRISEIELELAKDKLHRSRIQILTNQLVNLRKTYSSYPLHEYYPQYYYPAYSSLYSSWWLY